MPYKFVVSQKEADWLKSIGVWNEDIYVLYQKIK